MAGIIILFCFIVAGILTGLNVVVPYSYSQYIAVAILACLDSVFGALSANIEKKFKLNIFLSGFVCNALIAIFLVFIGNKLNVDIYLAVVVVFTWRLLNNLTSIRRDFVKKLDEKKGNNNSKKKDTNVDVDNNHKAMDLAERDELQEDKNDIEKLVNIKK